MTGQRVFMFLAAMAAGSGLAAADTEVVEIENSMAPVTEEVRTVESVDGARVRTILTLPGERRVARVRSFRVTRAPRVIEVTRPAVEVREVRSFVEPVVERAFIEQDLRYVPAFAPVVVDEHVHHHDDDDDDDDD